MFNFEVAEKRVRLGARSIKRKDWTQEYLIVVKDNILMYDPKYHAAYFLGEDDMNSEDWVDPQE